MNIGELFVKLGFQADTKQLNNMQNGLNSARLGAAALTAAVGATLFAVNKLISASLQSAVSLKNFEVQTGLSSEQLQKWSYVAEQNDVSAQSLTNSIKGIQKAQANLRTGQGNIKPFALLGISPTENPFVVLDQLRNRIKGLEPAIASSLLSQLGVGDDMLNLLRNSNLEFEKLNKKFLLTSKEQDKLIDLNKSYKDFIFTLRGIRDRLVAMISPQVMDFIQALKNTFEAFFTIGKGVLDLIDRFKWLGKVIAIVGAIVLAYFAPWTAIILGIILLVDDLWTMFKGGESVIGDVLKWFMKFEIVRDIVNFVKNYFKFLFDFMKFGVEVVSHFVKKFAELKVVKDIFNSFMQPLKLFFETLKGVWGFIGKILGKGADKLFNIDFDGLKDKIGVGLDAEQSRAPANARTSGNTSNNTNNINIVVDGANGDGNKIAFNIKEALGRQMNKAYYTSPAGV